jgi:hypothetical protein
VGLVPACGGSPIGSSEDSADDTQIGQTVEAAMLSPMMPQNMMDEHMNWHSTNHATDTDYGLHFLQFHRHFVTEVLQWEFGQGANLSPMYQWDWIPTELKTGAQWNQTKINAEKELWTLPTRTTEDGLGRLIDPDSGLHGFLHTQGAAVYNEPDLGDFMVAPGVTEFYGIHGLVELWHQHWLDWKRSNLVEIGSTVYARAANGNFYKMTGTNTWQQVSGPASMFVAVGTSLYKLSTDGTAISKYTGSGQTWTTLAGIPGREIFKCGASICATLPLNPFVVAGAIFRWNATNSTWNIISGPMRNFGSSSTTLYGVHPTGTFTYSFNESTQQWDPASTLAGDLFVTDSEVFSSASIDADTGGSIWHKNGSGFLNWEKIGGAGRTWVAIGSNIYGLTPSGGTVFKWTPTSSNRTVWTNIGSGGDWIYGTNSLYKIDSTGTIFKYSGSGTTWTSLGHP